ncbi:hypothetical protein [Sandaracinus amylolyticus]|uniref:hypothetical protein n=1 Tax=Sandaracinus amylolyticus TaxID=927083 RepID=UPI001F29A01B|nr:hypothetical protein [Sandaracinus amylolyticus]UJR83388.1 Hypothetical protein I5071_54560 [Sandaracinus amylolyticus]
MIWPTELEGFLVPGTARLFTLVPVRGERFVTLRHQQQRACNLAEWLSETSAPERVCVVGAGLAGLTFAAVYHELRGGRCSIVVTERQAEVLASLRGCRTRWLHPHFFTWPDPSWERPHTLFPAMNWRAGAAHDVYCALMREWKRFARTIRTEVRTDLVGIEERAKLVLVETTCPGREPEERDFDALVIATGPGLERRMSGAMNESYWHDDTLDREDPYRRGDVRHFAVAGNGDGALTDLLRIRLRNLVDHSALATLVRRLEERWPVTEPDDLATCVRRAQRSGDGVKELDRIAATLPALRDLLDDGSGLREGTRATLLGATDAPHGNPSAFAINRLLVAMLAAKDVTGFAYQRGQVIGAAKWVHRDRVRDGDAERDRIVVLRDRTLYADAFVARIGADRAGLLPDDAASNDTVDALRAHEAARERPTNEARIASERRAEPRVLLRAMPALAGNKVRIRFHAPSALSIEGALVTYVEGAVSVDGVGAAPLPIVLRFDEGPVVAIVPVVARPENPASHAMMRVLCASAELIVAGSVLDDRDETLAAWAALGERFQLVLFSESAEELRAEHPIVVEREPGAWPFELDTSDA